jgi:hypothetical protein
MIKGFGPRVSHSMPHLSTRTTDNSSFNSLPSNTKYKKHKSISWADPLVSDYDSKLSGLVWADILPTNPDALFITDKNPSRDSNSKSTKKSIWTRFLSIIYNLIRRKKNKPTLPDKDEVTLYIRPSLKASRRDRSKSSENKFSEIIIDEMERELIVKDRRSRVIRKSCSFS